MSKVGPTLGELTDRFHSCLKDTGGLPYGELVRRYTGATGFHDRAAKIHLARLSGGIASGEVADLTVYKRGRIRIFGRTDDKVFMDAKEAAEKEPEGQMDKYPAYLHLGGLFQISPVRSEWTECPVSNKIVQTTIITMGVADFMECPECSWVHFLGVSPRMKDRRLYAWQVDTLVNAQEYEDALSTMFIGDPKTFQRQRSRIPRIEKGGHYVGLLFRSSWDHDPLEDVKKKRATTDSKTSPRSSRARVA